MIDREKVALAIWELGAADDIDRECAAYLADAAIDAVLEQLREPSREVLAAGAISVCGYDSENEVAMMRDCWRAMIITAGNETAFLQPTESDSPAE